MHHVETAIAFVLVILTGSLLVNIVVRLIQAATGERARGVEDLLGQLHRGFCEHRGIRPPSYPAAQRAFLDAVLASPILHDGRTMADADAALAAAEVRAARLRRRAEGKVSAAAAERAHLAAARVVRDAAEQRRRRLWSIIQHVGRDDLLAILRACARPDGSLPDEWFGGATATKAPPTRLQERILQLQVVSPEVQPGSGWTPAAYGVSARDFHDHCRRWFATAEATVTERFAVAARRASVSVAALLVVLLNLDAFRLAYDLYYDRTRSAAVAGRAGDVALAAQAGDADGVLLGDPVQLQLERAAAALTAERVPIGWQDAWIVKRWCAYHGACADPAIPAPTKTELVIELSMWLLGLVASWILLSLGAPFWVGMLKRLSGLANLVAGRSARPGDPHRTESEAWERESDFEVPAWWLEASSPDPSGDGKGRS